MTDELKKIIGEDSVRKNVLLKDYTSFKVGGAAEIFIEPKTAEDLKAAVKFLYEKQQPYYILGNGSNLLVSDGGVKKPVIHIGKMLSGVSVFDECITARAGATLAVISREALKNSLSGFEFAAGIPGTLGGGVIMNAGAYGGEMKDVIEAVSYLDPSGEEHIAKNCEMEFSYRSSALQNTGCIVLGATICLKKGDGGPIKETMADLAMRRREKQPLEYPSAGSTFKRPKGYFAGTAIDECGLKGAKIGGACVSEKHAGFIINTGGATAADILNLINYVRETVFKKTGIELEPEVKYWD